MIIEGFRAAETPPLVQGRRKEVASVAASGGESHYLSVAHGSSSRRRRGAADHMIPGLSVRSRLPLCIAAQISGPYGPRMKPGVLRAACRGRAAECEAHQSDAGSDDETWIPSLHQCNRPPPPTPYMGSSVSLTICVLIIQNVRKKNNLLGTLIR